MNPNRNKDPYFHPRPKPYLRLKLERLNKNSEWVGTVKKVQVESKIQCEQKTVNNNNDPERQMVTGGKIGKVLEAELATQEEDSSHEPELNNGYFSFIPT